MITQLEHLEARIKELERFAGQTVRNFLESHLLQLHTMQMVLVEKDLILERMDIKNRLIPDELAFDEIRGKITGLEHIDRTQNEFTIDKIKDQIEVVKEQLSKIPLPPSTEPPPANEAP